MEILGDYAKVQHQAFQANETSNTPKICKNIKRLYCAQNEKILCNSTISRSLHTDHILDFVTFMFSFIIFHKMRHIYSLCMQNTMGLFGLE